MKVALVSGSWPPARCGVGDYSACLADALEQRGVAVLRYPTHGAPSPPTWRAAAAQRQMRADGAELIHIQYPTMGYGRSFFPSVLALASRVPVIVTLHEFSIFRAYRLPWFVPFATYAHTVILTSAAEAASFGRRMKLGRARRTVVPIGTNIGRGRAIMRDAHALCHFGLLLPGKDIEAFLDLAEMLRGEGAAWRLHLIGARPAGHEAYAARIAERARALGIVLHLDLPAHEVADLLSAMGFAYLPFPDGVSERRGSLLAALTNGVRVLTKVSTLTPDWLRLRVIDAPRPEDAARVLRGGVPACADGAQDDDVFGWESIADRHVEIYRAALSDAVQVRHG